MLVHTKNKHERKQKRGKKKYINVMCMRVGSFDYSRCVAGCDFLALSSRAPIAIYFIAIFAKYFAWRE